MSSDYCKRQTIRLVDRIDIITYNRSRVPAFAYGLRRGTQGSAFKGSGLFDLGFKIWEFGFFGSFSSLTAYRMMLHEFAFFDYEDEDDDDLVKSIFQTRSPEPTVRHVFQSEIRNPKSKIERP